MLLTVYLYEYFIDEERVTVASVLASQSAGINGPELYAPKTD
jgi:hypothetical protein